MRIAVLISYFRLTQPGKTVLIAHQPAVSVAIACSWLHKGSHPAVLANPDKPRQVHKILGDIWRPDPVC